MFNATAEGFYFPIFNILLPSLFEGHFCSNCKTYILSVIFRINIFFLRLIITTFYLPLLIYEKILHFLCDKIFYVQLDYLKSLLLIIPILRKMAFLWKWVIKKSKERQLPNFMYCHKIKQQVKIYSRYPTNYFKDTFSGSMIFEPLR